MGAKRFSRTSETSARNTEESATKLPGTGGRLPEKKGIIRDPLTFDKGWVILLSKIEGKMAQSTDLLQGTLDMLILKTLAPGQEHGWAIAQRIQQMSNDVLQVGQGSLYPALHRLEYRGWIRAEWGASENNRRARFYSLTAAGRKQLNAELENWERLTGAVNLVLQKV
jgi:PadR family transcriptional regulator PadR